jgi:hypothetical protein
MPYQVNCIAQAAPFCGCHTPIDDVPLGGRGCRAKCLGCGGRRARVAWGATRGSVSCPTAGAFLRRVVRSSGAPRISCSGRRNGRPFVILLDRSSFAGADPEDGVRAELAAVRHALAEYDVEHRLVRHGEPIAESIAGRVRSRA